ncbi:hypothetical protein D5086_000977 [Populus alba]|uniref:Uncharacterized protein n=1 Tax=Populus alba TaxID=43335 RepID=A0ACC4CYP7_POPAL
MSSSLFLTLILILISASQGCAAVQEKEQEKEPDLIQKSCSIIAGYEECVAILRSDPRSIKATTVKQLAYIILDLCIENATETLEEIPKLQEKYSKHDQIEEALRWCVMAYESAIKDYFRKAVDQLGTKSYREAQYSAHTGGALGTGCEQEFYFQAPVISPLWPRNHNLAVLGLVAEGIVSLLRLNESQLPSTTHHNCRPQDLGKCKGASTHKKTTWISESSCPDLSLFMLLFSPVTLKEKSTKDFKEFIGFEQKISQFFQRSDVNGDISQLLPLE